MRRVRVHSPLEGALDNQHFSGALSNFILAHVSGYRKRFYWMTNSSCFCLPFFFGGGA